MANEFLSMALANPEMLEALAENPNLDHRTRKIIQQIYRELMVVVQDTKARQDALSFTYQYSVAKAETTLTAIELMKALRSPVAPAAELNMLDTSLRRRYLELMDQLAYEGSLKIAGKRR
jgi:hypothetical protein